MVKTIRVLIVFGVVLITSLVLGVDKSRFDLDTAGHESALSKGAGSQFASSELTNEVTELTLISGGYFTLGTSGGVSSLVLDDNCCLTFGHPYAMTSYPVISVDGEWGNPEAFFDIHAAVPMVQGDSLVLKYSSSDMVEFRFCLKPDDTGKSIAVSSLVRNGDTQPHSLGVGLVFDPALGRKGDGWATIDAVDVMRDTLISGQSIPAQFVIKERIGKVGGMKLLVDLQSSPPDELTLANWRDVYENDGPSFTPSALRKLYDLTFKVIWGEQIIPAGDEMSRTVVFSVQDPDFDSPVFMRWDLPQFFSIEENLLFPRSLSSFVEMHNLTSQPEDNCQLDFSFPSELYSDISSHPASVPAEEIFYTRVEMRSEEIYEDRIVEVSAALRKDGQLLDSLMRRAFIPAIPLSDTGLVCTIDTVVTVGYPEIKFTLEAQVGATGQRLFNLTRENVFVYENDARVSEFTMGKDTTGGVTMADVVFVLDCSGSMGDDILAVRNNINEFCDSLVARGVDYRLGLVTFSTTIDDVYDLTDDVELYKSYLESIDLWGGRENSLGALYRATELSLRPGSKRTFVWITDEDYPVSPEIDLTVQQVIDRLLLYEVTVHSISEPSLQTQWCNPIIEPTGGNFYSIHGNFRDILLDISRMGVIGRYMIAYVSPGAISGVNNITAEVHYAGLGGFAYAEYSHPLVGAEQVRALQCYPNPFNPTLQILAVLDGHTRGVVDIFNILGQRVCSFPLKRARDTRIVYWDARDINNQEIAAGTYLVRLSVFGGHRELLRKETVKVLYLK